MSSALFDYVSRAAGAQFRVSADISALRLLRRREFERNIRPRNDCSQSVQRCQPRDQQWHNGNVHRAAAKDLQAEKPARPAAPCATYCYPTITGCGSRRNRRSPIIVIDFKVLCAVSSEFGFKCFYDFLARNSIGSLKSFVASRNMVELHG